jgi:YHS domain-containing protein
MKAVCGVTLLLLMAATVFVTACGSTPPESGGGSPRDGNAASSRDGTSMSAGDNMSSEKPKNEGSLGHRGDSNDENVEFIWDKLTPPASKTPAVDLHNDKDPVTLKAPGTITLEYKGFIVHFESEATRAKFEKKPLKFLNMLDLEPHIDGSVEDVDAASYQDAITDKCPIMTESEVDPHGTVYVLHRGWKFFFCCWSGCGDAFMKEPSKYYEFYGLVERDGKLVRK